MKDARLLLICEVVLQEDVPKPPPEEQYMLAQMQEVRRQLQASQQREAQKKVFPGASFSHSMQRISSL